MQLGVVRNIIPSRQLSVHLSRWIGTQRFIWNAKCEENNYFFRFKNRFPEGVGVQTVDQAYAQFKSDELTPWLKDIPSQIIRNGSVRWHSAMQSFFKRQVKGIPKTKKKAKSKLNCLVTSELFRFKQASGTNWILEFGTEANPLGTVKVYELPLGFVPPAQIWVKQKKSGGFAISFSQEDGVAFVSNEEWTERLSNYSEQELEKLTLGGDPGVVLPLISSNGKPYGIDAKATARAKLRDFRKKKHQRKLARQVKGSNRRGKTKKAIARLCEKDANVRDYKAHCISKEAVLDAPLIIAVEDTKIANMTRRPKPKLNEETGKYEKNGRAAKAGLNKALLNVSIGKIKTYIAYKAEKYGKIAIATRAFASSIKCSSCECKAPLEELKKNRTTQENFTCLNCGHSENADINAAKNHRREAIRQIKSGEIHFLSPVRSRGSGRGESNKTPGSMNLTHNSKKVPDESPKPRKRQPSSYVPLGTTV